MYLFSHLLSLSLSLYIYICIYLFRCFVVFCLLIYCGLACYLVWFFMFAICFISEDVLGRGPRPPLATSAMQWATNTIRTIHLDMFTCLFKCAHFATATACFATSATQWATNAIRFAMGIDRGESRHFCKYNYLITWTYEHMNKYEYMKIKQRYEYMYTFIHMNIWQLCSYVMTPSPLPRLEAVRREAYKL